MASDGMWAMPRIITNLILRSWTRRSTSLVGIVSRRAASDTRSISAAIEPSFVESQLTADGRDLPLELHQDHEMVAVGEHITSVLERGEEIECSFQVVDD